MSKCVECGYCCESGVCQFGVWDNDRKCCAFLTGDTKCAIYDKIQRIPEAEWNPAFGTGCSSSLFNEKRDEKIRELATIG